MKNENKYRQDLVKKIKEIFPDIIIIHGNPNEIQGIPDLILFYKNKYAMIETKKLKKSKKQQNQDYYIDFIKDWGSFASFVQRDNEEVVLNELRRYFEI